MRQTQTPIGVQLYALRRQLEADFTAALESIPTLGLEWVELARPGDRSAEEWKHELDRAGLKVLGAHIRLVDLEDHWQENTDFQRNLGNDLVIVPAPQPGWESAGEQEYRETARRLNRLGRRARSEGFRFAYHNHWWEFEPFGGEAGDRCGMDVLLRDTEPDLVGWEIDTAWVKRGGWDPVELLARQAGRVVAVHAKEYRIEDGSEPPMGQGDVEFAPVVELAERHGWPLVIEYEGEPALAGVAQGARYLKSLLESGG